jgi:hypothetical protein
MKYLSDIIQSPEDSRWNVCVSRADETGYLPVPAADISAFAEYQSLSATPLCGRVQMVMDPSHENRFALTWALADEFDSFHQYYFDAEFRADPGYPNLEDGFPVPLEAQPISDPALADLDADGQLEIIFGDSYGFVRVYRADGSVFPGWPVYCGTSLSDSPIAVADMNGDGTPTILAPSADGRVFGYNPDGSTTPGWPFDSGEDAYASVNVGHLGPPYPYVAVVIAGSKMHFLNYQGRQVPGSSVWNNDSFARGCAIGDHDNDGINEVVFRAGSLLLGAEMLMTYTDLYFPLGATGETTWTGIWRSSSPRPARCTSSAMAAPTTPAGPAPSIPASS